jgi:hypothetical protein
VNWEPPFVARGQSAFPEKGAFVDVQIRWSNAQVRSRAQGGPMHTHAWTSHAEAKVQALALASKLDLTAIPYRQLD